MPDREHRGKPPYIERSLGEIVSLRIPTDEAGETMFDKLQDGRDASIANGIRVRSLNAMEGTIDAAPFDLDNVFDTPGMYRIIVDPDFGPLVFIQARYQSISSLEWQEELDLWNTSWGKDPKSFDPYRYTVEKGRYSEVSRFRNMLETVGYVGSLPFDLQISAGGPFNKSQLVILERGFMDRVEDLDWEVRDWSWKYARSSGLGRAMKEVGGLLDFTREFGDRDPDA